MELIEQFKTLRNKMREYLNTKLVEYLDAVDDSEFDKANEIRQEILPISHMFHVLRNGDHFAYSERCMYLDYYNYVRQDVNVIKRLDLFMEEHWKQSLTRFENYCADYKGRYIVV